MVELPFLHPVIAVLKEKRLREQKDHCIYDQTPYQIHLVLEEAGWGVHHKHGVA